jgi:Ca2+-binding EF-hand superfamily protein
MLTDFQRRKLSRMFEMYDVDKNGLVEQTDYEQIAKNLSSIYGLSAGSPERAQLHATHMAFWNSVRQLSSEQAQSRVTREEFVNGYGKLVGNKQSFLAQMGGLADAVIAISDRNGDGQLSVKEYADNLRGFDMALSEQDAIEAARHLGIDGDGQLSRAEIMRLLEEFFYSEDPKAVGNGLLGKY